MRCRADVLLGATFPVQIPAGSLPRRGAQGKTLGAPRRLALNVTAGCGRAKSQGSAPPRRARSTTARWVQDSRLPWLVPSASPLTASPIAQTDHPPCLPRLPARDPCLSELYSYLIEIIKHRYKYRHNPYKRLRFIKILLGNSSPLRVDRARCIQARNSLSTVQVHLAKAGWWLRSSGLAAVAASGQHLGSAE